MHIMITDINNRFYIIPPMNDMELFKFKLMYNEPEVFAIIPHGGKKVVVCWRKDLGYPVLLGTEYFEVITPYYSILDNWDKFYKHFIVQHAVNIYLPIDADKNCWLSNACSVWELFNEY